MVTQKQIAQRLGVSQSAVAFAFHPTLRAHLSAPKRQRILDTARRLGYEPHLAARRLTRRRFQPRGQQFDQAGLIYLGGRARHLDTVCLAMIFGAEHELAEHRASFLFVNVSTPGGWEKVERTTGASGVDGWLVYGPIDDEFAARLKRGLLPFVIVGDHRCTQPVHRVSVDNAAVGRLAAQHLASHGHRRVAYLCGGKEFLYSGETLDGFRAARRELGLDEDERLIVKLAQWAGPGAMVDWLRRTEPKPTALFVSEMEVTAALSRNLREARIDVPGDISVLGCEMGELGSRNVEFARIELPLTEVGQQGAALLHRIVTEPVTAPQEVRVAPRFAEGGSVAPLQRTGGIAKGGLS